MAVEGTNVELTCTFTDSYPPVNNITFFDNLQIIQPTMVMYCLNGNICSTFLLAKSTNCLKLTVNQMIVEQTHFRPN